MSILSGIKDDLKSALKAQDAPTLSVLRYLTAQIHNVEIEKKGAELKDADILQVLQKEAKKRREAIELFKKGNRDDLVRQEESELAIMKKYLPEEIGRAEIEKGIQSFIDSGEKDFNGLMKSAMQKFAGRADGKIVSEVVKEKIAAEK